MSTVAHPPWSLKKAVKRATLAPQRGPSREKGHQEGIPQRVQAGPLPCWYRVRVAHSYTRDDARRELLPVMLPHRARGSLALPPPCGPRHRHDLSAMARARVVAPAAGLRSDALKLGECGAKWMAHEQHGLRHLPAADTKPIVGDTWVDFNERDTRAVGRTARHVELLAG